MAFVERYPYVLAIYPNSRGFGFVVLERQLAPVDWGVREVYGKAKNRDCLNRISALIQRYQPELILLRSTSGAEDTRVERIRTLNREIGSLAESRSIATAFYSRWQVRAYFRHFEAFTKQQIALVIAQHIPAFERLVPRIRRPWMSEDARMGIFDATMLAFRHFHELALRQDKG